MPDPRRLYRRITESNVPTRVVAHLSVVSLVAAASLAGVAQAQTPGASGDDVADSNFLPFVQSVRGAGDQAIAGDASSFGLHAPASGSDLYDLNSLSEERSALFDRAAPATVPDSGPMPTPVPVDPDATPLAAPNGVGQTTANGPSTRVSQPAAAPAGLVWPVPAGSISQYFHAGHLALDIAAPYGSQIVAAQGGVVTWAGWRNNGGGYVVAIDHGNGIRTVYNHLGSVWVSPGQYVGAGQGIGGIGCTGICTGPHVHFEVIVNGVIDNPLRHF